MNTFSFYFILFLAGTCTSCHANTDPGSDNCKKLYLEANERLNEFYQQGNQKKLDTALYILDKNIDACPDYNVRMVDLKIKLLILLNASDRGYKFIDSLDVNKFDKPYKKGLYLKNFKVIGLDSPADSVNRIKLYQEMINDLLGYLKNHPSDKEAIAELFFIKIKMDENDDQYRWESGYERTW